MSVTEQDLELLETYLDNALAPRQADALRMRMTQEPALSAMLEELRVQRAVRNRIFQSMEGSDRASEAVMCRLQSSIRRTELQMRHRKFLRLVSSAAACFIIGFGVAILAGGRFAGDNGLIVNHGPGFTPTVNDNTTVDFPINPGPTELGPTAGGSYIPPVFGTSTPEVGMGPYQVVLMNSNGEPIRIHRFVTLEEARQFTDKLQQQNIVPAGDAVVGERF